VDITPPADRADITDPADSADSSDSTDIADPMLNADAKDPTDPTDKAEPTDPMDRTDPRDPIDRKESCDHRDHLDEEFIAAILHTGRSAGISLATRAPWRVMTAHAPVMAQPEPVAAQVEMSGYGRLKWLSFRAYSSWNPSGSSWSRSNMAMNRVRVRKLCAPSSNSLT